MNNPIKTLYLLLFSVCISSFSQAQVIYVNHSASGTNDGNSWQNAFVNLQEGLALAEYGDEIWLAQGIYFPTEGLERSIYFELKNGVSLYGGFDGTESNKSERDWENNETILSGNIGDPFSTSDNSYTVLYSEYCDTLTVLDGITIERGESTEPSSSSTYFQPGTCGGGYFVQGDGNNNQASPTIKNCIFRDNFAQWEGGGIYLNGRDSGAVNLRIFNCAFYNNGSTNRGGAINKDGGSIADQEILIADCQFENNSSFFAGAVRLSNTENTSRTKIVNSVFNVNGAFSVGALSYSDESLDTTSFIMENCEFNFNGADKGAGAVSIGAVELNNYLIKGCKFVSNNGGYGQSDDTGTTYAGALSIAYNGSIWVEEFNSYFEINNCIFDGNLSDNGGAIYNYNYNVRMNNCLLINNNAGIDGGAFYQNKEYGGFIETNSVISNCTFYNNGALEEGASIYMNTNTSYFSDTLRLYNSILWNNNAGFTGNKIPLDLNHFEVENCLLEHGTCDSVFIGNQTNNRMYTYYCGPNLLFDIDPLFKDTSINDFRLQVCSPALNNGNADFTASHVNLDLANSPRLFGADIDLGPYEFELKDSIDFLMHTSCYNSEDGFVSTSQNGCLDYSYFWTRDTITGNSLDDLSPGAYMLQINDSNGNTDTLSFTISSPDMIFSTATITAASAINSANGIIMLETIEGGTPPYGFEWSNGASSEEITQLLPGEYGLTITDDNDCEAFFSFEVEFTTGFLEEETLGLDIYPNPAKKNLVINLGKGDIDKLEVYSSIGELVLEERLSHEKQIFHLDISKFTPGLYICSFYSKEEKRASQKVLIIP